MIAVGSDLDGVQTQNFAQPQPPQAARDQPRSRGRDEELRRRPRARRGRQQPPARALADAGARAAAGRARRPPARGPRATPAARSTRAPCASSTRSASPCPTTGSWSPTCASPATGWPGSTRPPHPRKLQIPLGWGTLGYAFPAALGAALADRGPTVAIAGDGGFLYAAGELATVAQERIPLTLVIVDDGGYGMLRYDQDVSGRRPLRRRPRHARLLRARARVRDPRRSTSTGSTTTSAPRSPSTCSTPSRACSSPRRPSRSSRRRTPRRTGTGAGT